MPLGWYSPYVIGVAPAAVRSVIPAPQGKGEGPEGLTPRGFQGGFALGLAGGQVVAVPMGVDPFLRLVHVLAMDAELGAENLAPMGGVTLRVLFHFRAEDRDATPFRIPMDREAVVVPLKCTSD